MIDLFRHWEGGEAGRITVDHFKAGLYILGHHTTTADVLELYAAMGVDVASAGYAALPFRELRAQLRVLLLQSDDGHPAVHLGSRELGEDRVGARVALCDEARAEPEAREPADEVGEARAQLGLALAIDLGDVVHLDDRRHDSSPSPKGPSSDSCLLYTSPSPRDRG